LAEIEITNSYFQGNDFTGSSFIGSRVENSTFERCNFTDGEWRLSRFAAVKFVDCDFNYTTVNLCDFDRCVFTGENSKRLFGRSVNYNVFTRSEFARAATDEAVLASNFGMRGPGLHKAIALHGEGVSLEEVCLASASGAIRVVDLTGAIENEFLRTRQQRLKKLRLEFISNILSGLVRANRISATSLAYVENLFATLARSALREAEILAAMTALLNIRSLMYDVSSRGESAESEEGLCVGLSVKYADTYSRTDIDHLREILGELACGSDRAFALSHFETGSTSAGFVTTIAMDVGAVIVAVNFALQQADVTLRHSQKFVKNWKKLLSQIRPKLKAKSRKGHASRVPALRRTGPVTPELAALSEAVARHGRTAVLLESV
jgi:hypothetical protein